MVTGRPSHDLEQLDEIARAASAAAWPARRGALFVVRQDHLAHRLDALLVEEHMLGAAEADALARRSVTATCASAGVSALARTPSCAHLVGPAHQRAELAGQLAARPSGTLPGQHLAGRAVDGDEVALLERSCRPIVMRLRVRNRRGSSRRRRRRACPCRAPPQRRARSCRRASVRMPSAACMP